MFDLYKNLKQQHFIIIISIILFFLFLILSFFSEGSLGGADDLWHYYFSRYAFQYPKFFLDLWAKPVFTLFSSPFAQFGYSGYKLFNVITGLLSAFVTYLVAKKLKYENSWLAIIFVCFMPIYAVIMLSGMTEILFSFILIFSIYLYVNEKELLAVIVISFLPYTRTEGYIILPLFFIILLIFRNYKTIPFLLTGTLLLTLIGGLYFDDFLWLKNKLPYSTRSAEIYGKGELLFYIKHYKLIIGSPLAILLLAGIGVICFKFRWEVFKQKSGLVEIILILGTFFCIFTFHSITWWLGTGTLGMTRFFAAIVPIMALICLKGFNYGINLLKYRILQFVIIGFYCLIVIFFPFHQYQIPVQLGKSEKLIQAVSSWLKANGYLRPENKFFYFDPHFVKFLDLNPFDKKRCQSGLPSKLKLGLEVPLNSLLLWDSHYGPNEERLPFKTIEESDCYKLVKRFLPEKEFKTFGDYNYDIAVFQRVKGYNASKINYLPDSIYYKERKTGTFVPLVYFDFDTNKSLEKEEIITTKLAHSGKASSLISEEMDAFIGLNDHYENIFDEDSIRIRAFVSVYAETAKDIDKLYFVLSLAEVNSMDTIRNIYFYKINTLDEPLFKPKQWNLLKMRYQLPKPRSKKDIIKIYLRNTGKHEYFIDDFLIEKELYVKN